MAWQSDSTASLAIGTVRVVFRVSSSPAFIADNPVTRRGDVSPTARTAWAAGQLGRLVATGALAERADLAMGVVIRSL